MEILPPLRADLRDAVRPPSDENVNSAFCNTTIEPSTQCIIARFASTCKINAIANVLTSLNLTSVQIENPYAPDVQLSSSKYARSLPSRIQPIVSPSTYSPPNDSMNRVYIQCGLYIERQLIQSAQPINVRPLAVIRRERIHRVAQTPASPFVRNRPGVNHPLVGSHRARMSIQMPPRNTLLALGEIQGQ